MKAPTDKELELFKPSLEDGSRMPPGYAICKIANDRDAQYWLTYRDKPISWAYQRSGLSWEALNLFAWRHSIVEGIVVLLRWGNARGGVIDQQCIELRDFDDPATADELIARECKLVHIERMDDGHIWIGIDTPDGKVHHINIWSSGRIMMRCEQNA
jgi:hypothetical protein